MHKLSYYTVFSDILNDQNQRAVFSSRTSKSLIISETCNLFLQEGLISEIPQTIQEKLINYKIIVPEEEDELDIILNENVAQIENKDSLYEVIQPSAMCQLGCYYCGQDHIKKNIGEQIQDKVIERIVKKLEEGNYNGLYIGWFGGEPLIALSEIRRMTKRFKEICAERNLIYTAKIVTNGLNLKPKIYCELVDELAISAIEVTLDGIAEFHDQHRYLKNGNGSFDVIFKNVDKVLNLPDFKEKKCGISIRCNVDEKNFEGIYQLIDHLVSYNWQHKISYFYTIGIYSWGGNDAHKKSLTKEEFAMKQLEWQYYMIEKGFKVGSLPTRKKNVCMTTVPSSDMYDAYGNIFSCTEVSYSKFYEKTGYVKGNIKKPEEINSSRPLGNWFEDIRENKFQCHSCRMLPVCGGGCPKSWYEEISPCPPAKFNIKERLKMSYILNKIEDEDTRKEMIADHIENINITKSV